MRARARAKGRGWFAACGLSAFVCACTRGPAKSDSASDLSANSAPPTVSGPRAQNSAAPDGSTASRTELWRRAIVQSGSEQPIVIRTGGRRAARGEHGVVSSVEAQATRAGVRILEAGGNAVDAAVAVAYALSVTHPSAGNLGGGGFLLVRPANGATLAFDFRETAPSSLTKERFDKMIAGGASGPAAVGVPGSVAGLNLVHRRFGRLPLERVISPAIALAKDGFRLGERQAETLVWNWAELKKDPAARAEFAEPGKAEPPKAGAHLRRPELARALERIAKQGDAGFYRGPTAEAIVKAASSNLPLDDLERYRPKEREPLTFRYRGLEIVTMPPPSAGGVAIEQTLLMLEQLRTFRLKRGSAEQLHLFIEAARRAHAERRFSVLDPDGLDPLELEARRRRWSDPLFLLGRAPAIDPGRATPSAEVHPLYPAAMRELEHTTHLSVADESGMIVSLTTTLSAGFGAKLVAPGTGIVLNNSIAAFGTAGDNLPAPGRRTTSSMAPTIVLDQGRPVLVLGTPGGDTIPNTIVEVFLNVVDYGMTIDDAVDAPRLHHGFAPDEVRYERARPLPKPVLDALEKLGHRLSKNTTPIGDANEILLAGNVAWAYADPREGGLALAAQPPTKELNASAKSASK